MKTKELRQKVLNAIKEAGLLKCEYDGVIETGQVFTSARTIKELEEVLEDIKGLSLTTERFSGFMNGILFTIKPL